MEILIKFRFEYYWNLKYLIQTVSYSAVNNIANETVSNVAYSAATATITRRLNATTIQMNFV